MSKRKNPLNKVVYLTALAIAILFIAFFTYNYFLSSHLDKPLNDLHIANNTASYANAVNKAAPAVVSIQTTNSTTEQNGLGSGVIVDKLGHILTNQHVIADTKSILVTLTDGRTGNAQVIGADPQTDIAVLQISLSDLPVIHLGTSSKTRVGDVVLAIGNPFGLTNTVTQGIISAVGTMQNMIKKSDNYGAIAGDLIQTDAAINVGNSGGALIDAHGNLIGINTAIISTLINSQGIGFAIPIDKAKQIMTQLIAKGSVTRGWIGAQLSDIPTETKLMLNYPYDHGIYVQDTIRNSPAQKAGLLPGDIITKINHNKVQDITNTLRLIANLAPEKNCNLEIFRQGKTITYQVQVAARM